MKRILYWAIIGLFVSASSIQAQEAISVQPSEEELPVEPELRERLNRDLSLWTVNQVFTFPDKSDDESDITSAYLKTIFRPEINSKEDLLIYLLGEQAFYVNKDDSGVPNGEMESPFQIVPGIEGSLADTFPNLSQFINNFPYGCRFAAAEYISHLDETISSENDDLEELEKATSSDFDKACLKRLGDVQNPLLLQATGVLLIGERPFCSATAIGTKQIVTALHCFFDDNLKPRNKKYAALRGGQVEIQFFEPQLGYIASAKVKLPESWSPPNNKNNKREITGYNDILVLNTAGPELETYVKVPSKALSSDDIPKTAWLIGSQNLISDLDENGKPVEDYARAVPPETCAVLFSSKEDCLVHSCQSGRTTSGAGLIDVTTDNDLILVGVHSGPVGTANGCDIPDFKNEKLNVAARYN